MRRSLGYKLERPGQLLLNFVGYLETAGAETVTIAEALAWATQPIGAHPSWWSDRLSVVRTFARHLRAFDPATEIPPPDLLAGHGRLVVPYLYSEADVAALMSGARAIPSPLRAATYETLIGLLAVTGMRVGEAIRLDRGDVDLVEGVLVVRSSKFGKSREVPLHASTLEALSAYVRLADRLCPTPSTSSLFVSGAGTRLIYNNVHFAFHRLVSEAHLGGRSPGRRPRPHDLRHTFAVRSLLNWYREGADVQVRLPLLSTYLGHIEPSSTYWYLSAAPELFELVCRRLEDAFGGQP
jgi:integrase